MSSKSTNEDDLLTSHNYDGIQEYDNPMPGWWTFIFITNVVWAVVYFVGINMDFLPEYEDDLRVEMAIQNELEQRAVKELPPVNADMLAEALANSDTVLNGASVFATNCAACHGAQGQGTIGPNLTDNAWLTGDGELENLHTVVASGTANGMPGWAAILSQDDLVAVVAFVKSIRGTSPPNPKAAEGAEAGANKDG